MNRLAHHIVDAAVVECQGGFKGWRIADGDHRSLRPVADCPGQIQCHQLALPDQEGFDSLQIGIRGSVDPLAELCRIKARRWYSFPPEKRCVTVFYQLPIINHYDHSFASESVWCLVNKEVRIR
jgi:hypothetical protein